MTTALQERLGALVRASLQGAELADFKVLDESAEEQRYVVRWARNGEYGTHVACLHNDGRSMLVWGHYSHDEAETVNDYHERT